MMLSADNGVGIDRQLVPMVLLAPWLYAHFGALEPSHCMVIKQARRGSNMGSAYLGASFHMRGL